MAVIDYSTDIGKLRCRIGDVSDLPFLPDQVIASVLTDSSNNLRRASTTLASMILGQLAFKTHRKLAQLEVWGGEAFQNYQKFLILTVKDPAFMDLAPLAYGMSSGTTHPLIQFQNDWNNNYIPLTQSQQLTLDSIPNTTTLSGAADIRSI